MPVELNYSHEVDALTQDVRAFVGQAVLPVEDEFDGDIESAGGDDLRRRLQSAARAAGVFAPHVSPEFGGRGLSMSDRAPVFEAAGYGLFGPTALNIAAPDEGNAHLLEHVASTEQREQFLAPLATGAMRSAFAMTEPSPGAGSDPAALSTRAVQRGSDWIINGRKHFITGADGAGFFIIMARTSGAPGDRGGATMFLAPADTDGIHVKRHIRTMDKAMLGGHCEVDLDDVVVPSSAVLGEVDRGFDYAQVRLGPARMTHVMRWLGAARRAHDTALGYVSTRSAFGGRLGSLGMVQQMVADNEIDIAAARALLVRACWELDLGSAASDATAIAKTFAGEALFRIADRSMQMCGGLGVSADLPVARIARDIRPFRVYDGPSEVHRWAIAKRAIRAVQTRSK